MKPAINVVLVVTYVYTFPVQNGLKDGDALLPLLLGLELNGTHQLLR
jgi:hypothetical protein